MARNGAGPTKAEAAQWAEARSLLCCCPCKAREVRTALYSLARLHAGTGCVPQAHRSSCMAAGGATGLCDGCFGLALVVLGWGLSGGLFEGVVLLDGGF